MSKTSLLTPLLCLALTAAAAPQAIGAAAPAGGGRAPVPVSDYPKPTAYPNLNKALVAQHLSAARKIAGDDLFIDFAHRCVISPMYRTRISGIQYNGIVEPTKLFDNLYSVGQNAVSSHALVTSAGIVLIDTLNNEQEARDIIVPNLVAMGLDPKNIKYIVISHAHGDHYGGAAYLQKTYGARVISSKIDWDAMDRSRNVAPGSFGANPPARDMEVADGQKLTVGDTAITFYITPGHTAGVVSMIFKVKDNGQPHTVGYFGGTGGAPGRPGDLRTHIASLGRWLTITRAAGVDTLVANHPLHDRALEQNEILRYRLPGDPNPYVFGQAKYQRYMQLQQECARVELARQGLAQ